MTIFVYVLCAVLFIMSVLLLLVSPIFGVAGIALSLLIAFFYKKQSDSAKEEQLIRKKNAEKNEAIQQKRKANRVKEIPGPSLKARKQITFNVAGTTFACAKDPAQDRQSGVAAVDFGERMEIEEYEYKGKPAYYVIDPTTGLDIGVIPADIAADIAALPGAVFEAYVVEADSFQPADKDEEIFTARIRLYVL